MKKFSVTVPIVGFAIVEVEAESAEAAETTALETVAMDEIEEWEGVRAVVTGNVFHGRVNTIETEELK